MACVARSKVGPHDAVRSVWRTAAALCWHRPRRGMQRICSTRWSQISRGFLLADAQQQVPRHRSQTLNLSTLSGDKRTIGVHLCCVWLILTDGSRRPVWVSHLQEYIKVCVCLLGHRKATCLWNSFVSHSSPKHICLGGQALLFSCCWLDTNSSPPLQ